MLIQKQYEFKCLSEWIGAGSIVYIPNLNNDIFSFILAAPYALFNSLLRPGPFDVSNALTLLSMMELLIVLTMALTSIYYKKAKHVDPNYLLFSLNFILLLGLLIGWTTPVLGAIVRYRVPILVVLLALSVHLLDKEKMMKLHSKIKFKI